MNSVYQLDVTARGERKLNRGDWWLDRNDVDDEEELEPGCVVDLFDRSGNYRARGLYSSSGPVAVRRISRSKVTVDESFFRRRIGRALRRRGSVARNRTSFRAVHGQGDLLPGLIVDVYDRDWGVVQLRNQAMDRRRDFIVSAVNQALEPRGILARNDVAGRQNEDLELEVTRLDGEPVPERVHVRREPYETVVNLRTGQKTGCYLDQVPNRKRFREFGPRGTVLDLFCYAGEWGLSALAGGAERVVFVDQSEQALALVKENLERNAWTDRGDLRHEDGFDYLHETEEEFDHAAIDPPAFAKESDQLDGAVKGYRDLNFRAMRQLKDGGLLATSSCSSPVDEERFLDILRQAREDADVNLRIMNVGGQGVDHPWLVNFPAGRYLTSVLGWVSLR